VLAPNKIILHASATRPEWLERESLMSQAQEIESWHLARKFSGIGYHFLIGRFNGEILAARPLWRQGAHCRDSSQNRHSIGVCLIGGYGGQSTDKFSHHFTEEQYLAVQELQTRFRLPLFGHNEFSSKACPCFNVKVTF